MLLGLKKNQYLALESNGEINRMHITNSREVKLFGIIIDLQLDFKSHVTALCVKANRKVSEFARVAKYIDILKANLLYHSFIASTIKYCPLIWMFCGKAGNDNIDRVHKRALRILLDNHESIFEMLLAMNGEAKIYTQNLRMLMIEIYKALINTNPSYMLEYYIRKDVRYDLRTTDLLQIPAEKSIKFGIDYKTSK